MGVDFKKFQNFQNYFKLNFFGDFQMGISISKIWSRKFSKFQKLDFQMGISISEIWSRKFPKLQFPNWEFLKFRTLYQPFNFFLLFQVSQNPRDFKKFRDFILLDDKYFKNFYFFKNFNFFQIFFNDFFRIHSVRRQIIFKIIFWIFEFFGSLSWRLCDLGISWFED